MKWIIHHAKRVARITSGIAMLIAGLIMAIPGVPGPGLLVMFAGLSVLAIDFVWAHHLKTKIQDKTKNVADRVRRKKPSSPTRRDPP